MTLRQEAIKYIADIPENRLSIIVPLLRDYAENTFVIETDLTPREKKVIAKGIKEYKSGAKFTPLDEV
jgi:hypothetical protein